MVKIPKEIILIKIDELKEYGKNARTHTAEQVAQVAASIKVCLSHRKQLPTW